MVLPEGAPCAFVLPSLAPEEECCEKGTPVNVACADVHKCVVKE